MNRMLPLNRRSPTSLNLASLQSHGFDELTMPAAEFILSLSKGFDQSVYRKTSNIGVSIPSIAAAGRTK
jgi:hypothetical protein